MYSFSIVIPHYNCPLLLERCIDSVCIRDDIQIIVVDDCSEQSEQLLSVFDRLKKRGVEIYFTDRGGSAGRARNVGLSHAKGKWIVFADSDDFFCEGMGDILSENTEAEEEVIYFRSKSVNCNDIGVETDRVEEFDKYFDNPTDEDSLRYIRLNMQVPWGKIVSRQLIEREKIRFDETRYANDAMFSTMVGCLAKKIRIENKVFYFVTSGRDSSLCDKIFYKPGEALVRAKVALRVRKYILEHGFGADNEYERYIKILLWVKDFKGLREIYCSCEEYGLRGSDILRIVKSTGRRYIPVYIWLRFFSKKK